MRTLKCIIVAAAAAATLVIAPTASASSVTYSDGAICHNGVLSDDAGQNCADGLYEATYGSAGSDICHNGILSDDAGQNCADGLYAAATANAPSHSVIMPSRSYGGSSNSMVNPACESGGNSQVVSPNGMYWGKYQFDRQTWIAHGGSPGSYGNASEAEQDRVAARVTYDAWPNC